MKEIPFKIKEDDLQFREEVSALVPDSDMSFTLVILMDGTKHFIQGTQQEIRERLSAE